MLNSSFFFNNIVYCTKKSLPLFLGTSLNFIFTFSIILSRHAKRILSGVAGESSLNVSDTPLSFRADRMASLIANITEHDKNSGGSPTA